MRRFPVCVRTDKGKDFLNGTFQALLRKEGIQFQVCGDPNVKWAIVERTHRTNREKLYRYMLYKNTYGHIAILPRFVRGYNEMVHSATVIAPS